MDLGHVAFLAPRSQSGLGHVRSSGVQKKVLVARLRPAVGFRAADQPRSRHRSAFLVRMGDFALYLPRKTIVDDSGRGTRLACPLLPALDASQLLPFPPLHPHPLESALRTLDRQ